jgi:hypothetical protein
VEIFMQLDPLTHDLLSEESKEGVDFGDVY